MTCYHPISQTSLKHDLALYTDIRKIMFSKSAHNCQSSISLTSEVVLNIMLVINYNIFAMLNIFGQ